MGFRLKHGSQVTSFIPVPGPVRIRDGYPCCVFRMREMNRVAALVHLSEGIVRSKDLIS